MWERDSLLFWKSAASGTLAVAAIAGGFSVTFSFVSAIIGRRVADVVQRESNEQILAANERIAKSEQRARDSEKELQLLNDKQRKRTKKLPKQIFVLPK